MEHKDFKLRKSKNFILENFLFYLMVVIAIFFIFIPLWLKNSEFAEWIAKVLRVLKTEGYKSTYIETIGSLFGTFLAITGAVWTQRKIDQKKEKQVIREHILIIYYDFYFVFFDMSKCINAYMLRRNKIENFLSDKEIFKKCIMGLKIYIHDEWIANVASIAQNFADDKVKYIYEIYGQLSTIKKIVEKDVKDISDAELEYVFEKMIEHIDPSMNLADFYITVEFKGEIKEIMRLLRKIGRISENNRMFD